MKTVKRQHIEKLVREHFGLKMTAVQSNEAMIASRAPQAKKIFKDELCCHDIHFSVTNLVDWLQKNIPLMHTIKGSRFDLPKVSHRKH